jgi:hypothetical protein
MQDGEGGEHAFDVVDVKLEVGAVGGVGQSVPEGVEEIV